MKLYLSAFLWLILFSCSHQPTKKPSIIAHRGASGYLPEHTLESYSLAYGLGADFIEPDIVLTKDNVPIILHDIHLGSTTNVAELYPKRKRNDGHYYAIDFTLAEIKKLRVHERKNPEDQEQVFPERFPSQVNIFTVPTFEEFLSFMEGLNKSQKKTIGIYPEIKRPDFHRMNQKDITAIVYNLLKKYGYENKTKQIFIQSFDPICLKRLKNEFKTKMPLIQLIDTKSIQNIASDTNKLKIALRGVKQYASGIGVYHVHLLNQNNKGQWEASNLVRKAKEVGLLLHPYTLRADQFPVEFKTFDSHVKALVEVAQVDGFFSDFTDKTKEIIKNYKQPQD